MGAQSKIEWTDATWNPFAGCSIITPGCTNCYAMRMAARIEKMASSPMAAHVNVQTHYAGTTKASKVGAVWTGTVVPAPPHIFTLPMKWKRPRKIFVNSMSDLWHERIESEQIDSAFAVMAIADQHEYQILTKRAERAAEYLLTPLRIEDIYAQWSGVSGSAREMQSWPMRHVLIGVSVEDQARANDRRYFLKDIGDAGWRTFVSYEPALGPVDWTGWEFLSWMISGGESGPRARPSHPDWHRTTRDWCAANGVPYLFKQWGEFAPLDTFSDATPDAHVYRVGKKAAGRLLDGKEYSGFPARPA